MATRKVLEEFAADNVIYLELRTTPRHVEGKMDQEQHIAKVIYSQTFISKRLGNDDFSDYFVYKSNSASRFIGIRSDSYHCL